MNTRYGAGDAKIAEIVNGDKEDGARLRAKFLKGLPALKKLIDAVSSRVDQGYVLGLDKRKIFIRHKHAALNTLLQSAGAIVCKRWVNRFHKILREEYSLVHGVHYRQAAFVHDEMQIHFNPKVISGETLGEISLRAITEVGNELGLRIPLASDYKIGDNYAECH